ncbi:MAG: hypothetical protein GY938_20525 [Ketobacter sp.]|nr:hypothetical protein [Ketobacter sp.]
MATIKCEYAPTTGAVISREITLNPAQEAILARWALTAYPTRTETDSDGEPVVIANTQRRATRIALRQLLRGFYQHIPRHRKSELKSDAAATLDSEALGINEVE